MYDGMVWYGMVWYGSTSTWYQYLLVHNSTRYCTNNLLRSILFPPIIHAYILYSMVLVPPSFFLLRGGTARTSSSRYYHILFIRLLYAAISTT